METPDQRRIAERREADQRSGECRRIDTARRNRKRRQDSGRGMADEDKFDRRGTHPSLFATLGYTLLRGVRRIGSARRRIIARRSSMRRGVDRRTV
jgi:hypothetical protein